MFNNLSFSFPGLDLASGTLTVPVWAAGAAAVVFVLFLILGLFRAGSAAVIGALVRVAFLVLAAAVAWMFVARFADRDRADERRALDQRFSALTAQATAPNSVLGCLEPGLGDAIDGSCEKLLFAGPETVGAATAMVAARWAVFSDGLEYVHTRDGAYDANLNGLRRSLQADRFGFFAQVLSEREGCTAAKCEAFDKLTDPNRIRANMSERLFESLVARNAVGWPSRTRPGTPMAAAPAAAPNTASNPSGITFPSAASIPPVSIMSNEPPAAPPANQPPAARRPPAGPTPAAAPPRPAPLPQAARPVPLTPPAANGSSTTPTAPAQQ